MQENEFEKKVQQKMQDFNLRPADEVWKEVERRIRKEKKRRFIFWWFLLFVLVAGGIGAGILLTSKKEKIANNPVNETEQNKGIPPTAIKSDSIAGENAIGEKKDTRFNSMQQEVIDTEKVNSIVADEKKFIASETGKGLFTNGAGKVKKKREAVTERTVTPPVIIPADVRSGSQETETGITKDIIPEKATPPIAVQKANTQADILIQDTSQKKPVAVTIANPVDTAAKAVAADTKKDKKGNKWNWGISLAGGSSSVVKGIGSSKSLLYADAATLGGGGGSPSNPAASISSPASHNGIAWGGGVNVRKALSSKLDIEFGLGYDYLSTRMSVGSRVDSVRNVTNVFSNGAVVNNFYRTPGSSVTKTYTNQYHFASLSADLSWKIINGKKFKLNWNNGLQYKRLISSTMLHYDRNLPGYYKDNTLLNKNQVFITTGFSIPVTDRLRINPFINYSLTPVLNVNDAVNTHYTDFGIRVNFQLNKK